MRKVRCCKITESMRYSKQISWQKCMLKFYLRNKGYMYVHVYTSEMYTAYKVPFIAKKWGYYTYWSKKPNYHCKKKKSVTIYKFFRKRSRNSLIFLKKKFTITVRGLSCLTVIIFSTKHQLGFIRIPIKNISKYFPMAK